MGNSVLQYRAAIGQFAVRLCQSAWCPSVGAVKSEPTSQMSNFWMCSPGVGLVVMLLVTLQCMVTVCHMSVQDFSDALSVCSRDRVS